MTDLGTCGILHLKEQNVEKYRPIIDPHRGTIGYVECSIGGNDIFIICEVTKLKKSRIEIVPLGSRDVIWIERSKLFRRIVSDMRGSVGGEVG